MGLTTQSCYNTVSKMSYFQQKIIRYEKKQESVTQTQEKEWGIETDFEEVQL